MSEETEIKRDLLRLYEIVRAQQDVLFETQMSLLALKGIVTQMPGFLDRYKSGLESVKGGDTQEAHDAELAEIDAAIQRMKD